MSCLTFEKISFILLILVILFAIDTYYVFSKCHTQIEDKLDDDTFISKHHACTGTARDKFNRYNVCNNAENGINTGQSVGIYECMTEHVYILNVISNGFFSSKNSESWGILGMIFQGPVTYITATFILILLILLYRATSTPNLLAYHMASMNKPKRRSKRRKKRKYLAPPQTYMLPQYYPPQAINHFQQAALQRHHTSITRNNNNNNTNNEPAWLSAQIEVEEEQE